MKLTLDKIFGIGLMLGVLGFLVSYSTAFGAPSIFIQKAASQTATSTVGTQLTVGAGTSTLTYDSWQRSGTNQTDAGGTYAPNKVALLAQVNASSTSSVFQFRFEYSQDGIDWYSDNIIEGATTTAIQIGAVTKQYQWTFASSTIGGVAVTNGQRGYNATLNRDSKILQVPLYTRFVRVVVSVTGANGYFYGEFQPIRETQ